MHIRLLRETRRRQKYRGASRSEKVIPHGHEQWGKFILRGIIGFHRLIIVGIGAKITNVDLYSRCAYDRWVIPAYKMNTNHIYKSLCCYHAVFFMPHCPPLLWKAQNEATCWDRVTPSGEIIFIEIHQLNPLFHIFWYQTQYHVTDI